MNTTTTTHTPLHFTEALFPEIKKAFKQPRVGTRAQKGCFGGCLKQKRKFNKVSRMIDDMNDSEFRKYVENFVSSLKQPTK